MTLYNFLPKSSRREWMRLVSGMQSPDGHEFTVTGSEPMDIQAMGSSELRYRPMGAMRYERDAFAGETWCNPVKLDRPAGNRRPFAYGKMNVLVLDDARRRERGELSIA